MSDMKGNPHYIENLANATQLAEHAASQATLALAYEQRTANLIAARTFTSTDPEQKVLEAEIFPRLGLERTS